MDTYTAECYDSIALFLCVHIVHRYKVVMHKRNAPVLDKSVTLTSRLITLLVCVLLNTGLHAALIVKNNVNLILTVVV